LGSVDRGPPILADGAGGPVLTLAAVANNKFCEFGTPGLFIDVNVFRPLLEDILATIPIKSHDSNK
jgi:hypothetical protein